MAIYYCVGFTGHRPVGTAAIVSAKDIESARIIMDQKIKEHGLIGLTEGNKLVKLKPGECVVLLDGDY